MKKKVLIGMSGGVDSAVAASLLLEEGYDVIGITLKLWAGETESGCCSVSDTEDARNVAHLLDIPFYVLNFKDVFQQNVVTPFVQSYLDGETPNPCISCNDLVKFSGMLQKADALGVDFIATGHYARLVKNSETGRVQVRKASDDKKDQSYVLYRLTQEQLTRTLFPLGNMTKNDVRAYAENRGLRVSKKPDSQDICFVDDGHYASFVQTQSGILAPHGNFIDTKGHIIGTHKGLPFYTIGQRKHLGYSFGERKVVLAKSATDNTVTVGGEVDAYQSEIHVRDLRWQTWDCPPDNFSCMVRTRYSGQETAAEIHVQNDGSAVVCFQEPKRAPAPGQAAVFYQEVLVLGGGVIDRII